MMHFLFQNIWKVKLRMEGGSGHVEAIDRIAQRGEKPPKCVQECWKSVCGCWNILKLTNFPNWNKWDPKQ